MIITLFIPETQEVWKPRRKNKRRHRQENGRRIRRNIPEIILEAFINEEDNAKIYLFIQINLQILRKCWSYLG